MPTRRQARHGSALLSMIVSLAVSAASAAPPAQADASGTNGEGDDAQGLNRGRSAARDEQAAPAPPPQATNSHSHEQRDPATPAVPAASSGRNPLPASADSASRQSYNEYLIRDRAVTICLAAARRAIEENRDSDALVELQTLFDAPADVFVWSDKNGAPQSARSCAADLFRQLPATAVAEYERRYGPDAQRLLEESRGHHSGNAQRELLRRYEFTSAGADALRLAADHALDCGEFIEAARLYQRWLNHPAQVDRPDAGARLRAEAAALIAHQQGHAVELPDMDAGRPLHVAGKTQSLAEWRTQIRESVRRHANELVLDGRNWQLAFGNPQTHRQSQGTLPTLDPLWSASHGNTIEEADDGVRTIAYEPQVQGDELLTHWMESRAERRLPCAGATFAIVDNDCLIVRDFFGVTARNLRTGEIEWRFGCESGLSRCAARAQAAAQAAATPDPPIAAALLFNELVAQNSVFGMLASDGRHVFCVDHCPRPEAEGGPTSDLHSNRLLALALKGDGHEPGSLVWQTVDDGRFFLGAPLPTEQGLFAIAELDSLVSLVALDPQTGRLRWEQPISLVDAAIENDPQRARQACTPTFAGGILVCPTQLGTVVGIDARSGALEWVYAYAESNGPSQPWRKSRAFDREYGSPEYPNLPVIVDGIVLILAPQSKYVHAVDLQTGKQCWPRVDRGDSQYVVAVGDDLALLVGLRECRALRITDGQLMWEQSIKTPAGRGLALGDTFLLPTEDGRIISIDIHTGRLATDFLPRTTRQRSVALRVGDGVGAEAGSLLPEPSAYAGNLLCSGSFIVSCSPAGVAVYPQAGIVLEALVAESRAKPLSASAWLERGELELRLGDVQAAEASLWNVLREHPSPQTRMVAASRLRELMYVQLAAGDNPQHRLTSLARLCTEPSDRARFFIHKLNCELISDDFESAVATCAAIGELGIGQPVAIDAGGEYAVLPERHAAAALVRHRRKSSSELCRALRQESFPSPQAMLDVAEFGVLTSSNRDSRASNVERLIANGEFQAAELLLLAETRLPDDSQRHAAQRRLAALWRTCGLPRDAAHLLAEEDRSPSATARPRIAHARIEQQIAHDDGTSAVSTVVQSPLEELLARNREYTRQPSGSRVLFDRGLQGGPERSSAFSVVDLTGPRLVADLAPLPARVWKCGDSSRYDAGHFVPLAGQGDVHGVSLLEGRILWSASATSHRTGDKPQLGPYGPEYCILQSHEIVTALHPRDGRVLWRRSDIPYDAGLVRDEATGMIADECALVIFEADLTAYRLFDPRSGEQLRTGVLEASSEPRRRGWAFGRRLLYVTAGQEPRMKLWDPLAADPVLNEPCRGRCLIDSGLGSGLAAILNGRQLSILDTASTERLWATELSEEIAGATRQIRAVKESDWFCIHLEQDVADSATSPATHDISGVPNLPISGMLFVIDRRSGQFWSRSMPRCNLLLFPNDRLPVLVTLGRTRESPAERGAAFVMEVIDGAAGRTLASRSDLARTSKMLLHARYDSTNQLLELLGRDAAITVQLADE